MIIVLIELMSMLPIHFVKIVQHLVFSVLINLNALDAVIKAIEHYHLDNVFAMLDITIHFHISAHHV